MIRDVANSHVGLGDGMQPVLGRIECITPTRPIATDLGHPRFGGISSIGGAFHDMNEVTSETQLRSTNFKLTVEAL